MHRIYVKSTCIEKLFCNSNVNLIKPFAISWHYCTAFYSFMDIFFSFWIQRTFDHASKSFNSNGSIFYPLLTLPNISTRIELPLKCKSRKVLFGWPQSKHCTHTHTHTHMNICSIAHYVKRESGRLIEHCAAVIDAVAVSRVKQPMKIQACPGSAAQMSPTRSHLAGGFQSFGPNNRRRTEKRNGKSIKGRKKEGIVVFFFFTFSFFLITS